MSPGYFGKFPSHGDFITRRLPRDGFLDIWDQWLQSALATSQEQLREAWLPTYLTSPVWRFVLSPGVCGPTPWAGIMMPSVDSVGRYFPLTFAGELDESVSPLDVASDWADWFTTLEDLALSALDEPFDLQDFDRRIAAWTLPTIPEAAAPQTARRLGSHGAAAVYVTLHADQNPSHTYPTLLDHLLRGVHENYSLWWTVGSDQVEPCLLACGGLPPVQGFAALLGGNWSEGGWQFGVDAAAASDMNQATADPA